MIQKTFRLFRRWHSDLRRTEHIYMVLVALVIGIFGGLCAVGFRELIRFVQYAAWFKSGDLVEHIKLLPWWWKVSVPTAGGLVVGLITYYFAREAKGHGVPEVMEAVTVRSGRIRPRVVLAKMFASGICIASGGSVGREGPIVQIGSSLGSSIGQWLKIDERRLRTLVGCGAAAGIAATFNAPVAGALFAVEIILSDFGVSQFSPIVISSVSATVVGHYFLGDFPAFIVPRYSMATPLELFAYAVLGLVAGLVAVAFVKTLYGFEDFFDRIRLYSPAKTAVGGLIIGIIALSYPQVLGVGYDTINLALSGNMVLDLLVVLVLVKIIGVSITIGSGGSGGIFAPSLFIGAMVGGAIGVLVNDLWPGDVAGAGAYALVGMAAVVAASTHAPITAILIVFELTNDYKIILPLMISCIIATILSTRLSSASIYTLKLLRRGIDIYKGRSVDVLKEETVSSVMREDFVTVPVQAPLISVVSHFVEQPGDSVFVTNRHGKLIGLITMEEVRPVIADIQSLQSLIIAKDLMTDHDFPVFSPDDNLADVMKRLGTHVHVTPVVKEGEIVGSVWPDDVIRRYNEMIFKRDMASGVSSMVRPRAVAAIPGAGAMKLVEMRTPLRHAGRTIADLHVRKEYGVSILLIKRKSGDSEVLMDTVPTADTVLEADDTLLVMGSDSSLLRFERG